MNPAHVPTLVTANHKFKLHSTLDKLLCLQNKLHPNMKQEEPKGVLE